MKPLDLLHLSAREREILEYIAFKFVKYDPNSYYRYGYGYGYSYGYSRTKYSEEEFENALKVFNSNGWFAYVATYSRKGEIDKSDRYLHPTIFLEVLKRAKNSTYLKIQSSWSDYDIKAMRMLAGEKKDKYIDATVNALKYDGIQPLETYLAWSLFSDAFNRDWLKGFTGYWRYDLDWERFQMAYVVKNASSTCFLFYKDPEIQSFIKNALTLFDEDSGEPEQIEDSFHLGWDFVIKGSAQEALKDCHEHTEATSWILAAGLLRQKDYKKAFQCSRSAAKQKAWCSGYRSALEDLIYGLTLYHNRESSMASKKIKDFNAFYLNLTGDGNRAIGWRTTMNACSIVLSRLCSNSVSSAEFKTIWKNFVQQVKAEDRLIFFGLLMGYLGVKDAIPVVEELEAKLPTSSQLIKSELYAVKRRLFEENGEEGNGVEDQDNSNLFLPIINNIVVKKDYEIALNQLNALMKKGPPKAATARVIYLFDDDWGFSLRQQKYGRNGWGALNPLSFKSFTQGVSFMDSVDRQIAAIANTPNLPNWKLEILKKLVGSERVYSYSDPSTRIIIEEIPFEIATKTNPDKSYTFVSNVPILTANQINQVPVNNAVWWNVGNSYFQKDNNVIKICHLTDEQKQMADILLRVPNYPSSVKKDLTQILETASHTTTVMSDLLEDAENLPLIKGLSQLTVRIEPIDEFFDVKALLYLTEDDERAYKPGIGLTPIATTVNGKNVRIERDLKKEKENYDKFMAAAEPFSSWEYEDGSWQLDLPEMLELLEAIRELGDAVRVEWPEGVQYKVARPVRNFGNFSLNLYGRDFWLKAKGELKLDEEKSLTLEELLPKIREAKGRFIQLDNNEFIALNKKLMKELRTLEEISSKKGGERQLSRYSVGFIKNLEEEGIDIESDGDYEGLVERIEKASELDVKIPKSFVGQLRPYQKEGYEWMARLASWDAGGILADDMGLGKTVQAIALLGLKKNDGPSLVVCPSSVLINWKNEFEKFDPSLNVRLFNKEDRQAVLKEAKAGDVVLSTYGVLSTEIEQVSKVDWNVVVLDEAHSIKNRATLVSKSVKQLKAKSRFLLTGTPIQNHLSEIWNLIDYANPGLLGSFNAFSENFISQIERKKDFMTDSEKDEKKRKQTTLKNLIAPFMLRRTKQEVEQELPPRTEVELKIPLSKEEQVLYDQLNAEAWRDIEENPQGSAISILAHLTKLRKVACHPELVYPTWKLGSSKTTAFLTLAQRLISEGHRALVFSQFTTHLDLIKRELDALKIPYLYLDGSNTPTERDKLKRAFQEGTAPLFLISLKAGGLGLTLTAADYVIHLDPWWNPAVEDQASDRAHRIGQDKPVHIYKLIAEGTIEEKILRVHQDKKQLADALLAGTDISAKFSRKEILDILKSTDLLRGQ